MATALADIEAVNDEEAGDSERSSEHLAEVHKRALRRFDDDVIPQAEIRAHALLCRRFISEPGAQWADDWGDERANAVRVEIDKLSKGVEKIENDYRQNRIVPDFRPAGGDSNQSTADTLDGLLRADADHFNAQQGWDNGFTEGSVGGFGAWRLTNVLADPYDKDSDHQRINPGMLIPDADQRVFFDGNSKLYDKSDSRYAFVLTADTREAFEEDHPGKDVSWPDPKTPLSAFDGWFQPDTVLKCEYYEVEEVDAKLIVLTHRLSQEEQRWWEDDISRTDLDDLRRQGWQSRTTTRKRRRVRKYLMTGAEVLKDQGYIAGPNIPIVPFYGKRWFVNNVERFRGHVSKRMDSQRAYNMMFSKLVETSALSPREKPIFLAEQMPPNLAELWKNQEIERHPYALVNPVFDPVTGGIAAMGPIGKVEAPSIGQADAAILQMASSDLTDEDQQADEVKANVSADAMDIAAQRVDAKSGIYLDNMRLSMKRTAEIYLGMVRDGVYSEPGRAVETMSEEGDDGEAVLHQPYTDPNGRHMTINDFASGKYKVICTVTEATTTRRDKTVRSSLSVAEIASKLGDNELGSIAVLTAVLNQDGEGMDPFQKYARKRLVAMGVEEPTDEEKQQMEAAQQGAQPDPAAAVAAAQAQALQAKAGLDTAKAQESGASTVLKLTQAHALGGPSEAPSVPDGLEAAERAAHIDKTQAEAERIRTEAAHLPAEINIAAHKAETDRMKIRRGSELN